MKLAEALLERSDLQKRLSLLESRLCHNARVQEGESPAEDPKALLAELEQVTCRLEELIRAINLTNAAITDKGESLTALLARRDMLSKKVGIMQNFLSEASATASRATRSEIAIRSTVPVAELRKDTDKLSAELRALDTRIQALNWTAELM